MKINELPNSEFVLKLAIQYNRLHHTSELTYRPCTDIDNTFLTAFPLFLKTLPPNYEKYSVTEIGSGFGKWAAVFCHYFTDVVSIEPNNEYLTLQKKFLSSMKATNVTFKQDLMPDCIDSIKTNGIFFIESLYLANNWIEVINKIIANPNITYVGIIDGPDSKPLGGTLNTPAYAPNRLPLQNNDALVIKKMFENAGFKCKMFNVWEEKETDIPCQRWFIVAYK
jgi:hypothetical protein